MSLETQLNAWWRW